MCIELKLKDYILSKYKNIKAFSEDAGIPYTTVNNLFTRGLSRTGMTTIVKICNTLDIEIESLEKNKIVEKKTSYENFKMSKEEKSMLLKFRELAPDDQKYIAGLIDRFHETIDAVIIKENIKKTD